MRTTLSADELEPFHTYDADLGYPAALEERLGVITSDEGCCPVDMARDARLLGDRSHEAKGLSPNTHDARLLGPLQLADGATCSIASDVP
jgi:hypothetical protein